MSNENESVIPSAPAPAAAAPAPAPLASIVSQPTAGKENVVLAPAYDDAEEEMMPWEDEDWVPRTSSGKQKTPNQIRGELQRYIDASSETKTSIVRDRLRVNNKSFGNFMNPKYYKDQWSAVQNGTYWAAARLLEQHKHEQKLAKKASGNKKRKSDENGTAATASKKPKVARSEMEAYMAKVNATELPQGEDGYGGLGKVYDSCPQVVKKVKEFLAREGVTKAAFLAAIGNVNSNTLNRFLARKKQDGAGLEAYPKAYFFFERMRIMENQPKSKARLKNELEHPRGFSTDPPRMGRPSTVYFSKFWQFP